MFVEDAVKEVEYAKGFQVGQEWLASGRRNFRHPSVQGGYIPGGPIYFIRANSWDKEYRAMNIKVGIIRTAWTNGFIDGINKYVRDHNLDYPQLQNYN